MTGAEPLVPATVPDASPAPQPSRQVVPRCRLWRHKWSAYRTIESGCERWLNRVCLRCGEFQTSEDGLVPRHDWTLWEPYEITGAHRGDDGIVTPDMTVTRQRRRCRQCGELNDKFVRLGPLGPPLPPLDGAGIDRGSTPL